MYWPFGIAVDTAGDVYVSDGLANNRIQRFDSDGNFERAWGKDVVAGGGTGLESSTLAANCQAGSPGGLGGEMEFPAGITVDPAGDVYIDDSSNNRMQKFDSDGTLQ